MPDNPSENVIKDTAALMNSDAMEDLIKSVAGCCAVFYKELIDCGVPEIAATAITANYAQSVGNVPR